MLIGLEGFPNPYPFFPPNLSRFMSYSPGPGLIFRGGLALLRFAADAECFIFLDSLSKPVASGPGGTIPALLRMPPNEYDGAIYYMCESYYPGPGPGFIFCTITFPIENPLVDLLLSS